MSGPATTGLDHVPVAIPEGGEAAARAFHLGVLGAAGTTKPEALRDRGGFWPGARGAALHLGIDPDSQSARKAHVAPVTGGLDAVARALGVAGRPVARDAVLERPFTEHRSGDRPQIVEIA